MTQIPDSLLGRRDRALLLLGFAGAFRRSELVALDINDLETNRDGLTVQIRRSKTDQEGRKLGIPKGTDPSKRSKYGESLLESRQALFSE